MAEGSHTTMPSEMLRYFDDAMENVLPDDEYQRLTTHDAEIARTTSRGDFHRCLRCAQWAVELTAEPEHSHLAHLGGDVKAVLHVIHDADWAVAFGAATPGRVVTDVELAWVDDAVSIAQAAAQRTGWPSVPWERLLEELIAIEPSED